MAQESLSADIGRAWRMERDGDTKGAIAEFERILKKDGSSIDGLYGMGMAQRRAGDHHAAQQSFSKALDLVNAAIEKRNAVRTTHETATLEDDRNNMLVRMLKQRLSELQSH
jgi:Tfp pilus assembly protein PilF